MRRPNLLFLFTDEQRADTLAAYGNTRLHAPHLNRLAAESVVFRKCYVTQPVCTPSRSSLMTGLYPHTNGCIQNNAPLPEDIPCISEMTPGCRTAYFGKWHLGDEVFPQHGFEHWVSLEDMYIPYYRKDRDRNARSSYHQWLMERGYQPPDRTEHSPGVFSRSMTVRFAEPDCKPAFLAEQVCDWLRNQERGTPFLAYVSFLEPHMPFTGPRNSQYNRDDIEAPANFGHLPGEKNHPKAGLFQAAYRNEGYGDFRLDTEQGWRRLMANYWGLVSQVDTAVGSILETLAACGLEEDTIVVFTSDHGDMMGSHRLLAKCIMFEEAITVPLLIKAPGVAPRKENAAVSQIDLAPTLLDLLGHAAPKPLQGASFRALLEQGEPHEARDIFVEWNGPDSGVSALEEEGGGLPDYAKHLGSHETMMDAIRDPIRTIVSPDGWKLNFSPALGAHELYDLSRDPLEMENLYGEASARERFEELKSRIRVWGNHTGDRVAAEI